MIARSSGLPPRKFKPVSRYDVELTLAIGASEFPSDERLIVWLAAPMEAVQETFKAPGEFWVTVTFVGVSEALTSTWLAPVPRQNSVWGKRASCLTVKT
jgi:hypothetical protein